MTNKKVLIVFPCHHDIFIFKPYDLLSLKSFVDYVLNINLFEVAIKYHPRHKSTDSISFNNNKNVKIFMEDNFDEIIDNYNTIVFFETSTAIIDSILKNKLVIYIKGFSFIFNNEFIFKNFINKLPNFDISMHEEVVEYILNEIKTDPEKKQLLKKYCCELKGDLALKKTIKNLEKIIKE